MSGDPEISVVQRYSVQLAIFVGFAVILITLILKWIRKDDQTASGSSKHDKPEKQKSSSGESSSKHGKKEQTGSVKTSSKKKLTERENRRNMRANEKGMTSPWFLGTYKGHTGKVSGIDLSANGKFIASCSDDRAARRQLISKSAAVSSKNNTEASSSQSPSPAMSKSLSRRQKKNRKIAKEHQKRTTKSTRDSVNDDSPVAKRADDEFKAFEQYVQLCKSVPIHTLVSELRTYCLDQRTMSTLGYPAKKPKGAYAFSRRYYALDVHAEEFVPRKDSEKDSGNGSASGNTSEEETSSTNSDMCPDENQTALNPGTIKMKDCECRLCVRCGKYFYVSSKGYITMESCLYHWGKLELSQKGFGPMLYSCCSKERGVAGCSLGKLHVSVGYPKLFVNSTFVETEPPKRWRRDGNYGVYGLDCEMSYTIDGLEAVKVTLVDLAGRLVYDSFVKPKNEIVDFNTRFSGIDEEIFKNNHPKSLARVQRDLMKFITSETIVIGHGLENDFKALHMVHKTVVDTSFTFPDDRGLPFKRSLKSVTKLYLCKDIQCGSNGHDSVEDARACVELMLLRVKLEKFPMLN
ncbi:uncharacterized protein LOC143195283 isoform X2 [Rhynchophorus ferrugineus]|uniref:uncharacterized protein LOC143195283 isoform X2 n=1 Tax=Rhynchophorus ferrugineus TaxID=354439 RepID=UPI003FCD17C6